ncbi:DNA (cytosine-5)-methyltransferase 1 [Streptosporangium album]|uniref:DNA (Cytosine-5)-methyltransferase 1 n=1 Tax=Streptosporangium album TaxID=47479 RepID=A0A7W7WBB7_9ACTN|nr:DNA cytosine methyltransferase [Streptosporangium album]MBB4940708.1 DNA (cytosine-5)-methyltransferase 1 [Streptosporangium album]
MSPRIGSLCTGYGGLDLAVMDVLGGAMAWHCQYDPDDKHQYAARILAHHWPDVPNRGDITAVDWSAVEPVDILTAGFPCQDLSYAGRGAGIQEGNRSGLWYAIESAVRALRPGLVVLENVAAIVARRPGLDVVLAGLADLGFDAEWTGVRASDVGATHQRNRWFLLAWPAGTAAYAADLGHERGRRARDGRSGPADRRLAPADADLDERARESAQQPRRVVVARSGGSAPVDPAGERHGNPGPTSERGVPAAALAGDPADREWGAYGPAIARWEHVLGRPAPGPVDDRGRLAPVFVEWLMGLPAGHVTEVPGLPRNAQLKALGNGVVPKQAVYALRLLLARLDLEVAA